MTDIETIEKTKLRKLVEEWRYKANYEIPEKLDDKRGLLLQSCINTCANELDQLIVGDEE